MTLLFTQQMVDAAMPRVRRDLGPELRLHVANLIILRDQLVEAGLDHHPRYSSTTVAVLGDEIAKHNGHRHEFSGGTECVHCGWERQGAPQ